MIRTAITTIVIALLSACTGPGLNPRALEEFTQRQSDAARSAAARDRLRDALTLWQTVIAADPDNAEAIANIATLKTQIADATQSALRKGRAAYARGARRSGDSWMLEALALTPAEPSALEALRVSASNASHDRQQEKIESAYVGAAEDEAEKEPEPAKTTRQQETIGPELERLFVAGDFSQVLAVAEAETTPLNKQALAWVRKSHMALAQRAGESGDPQEQLMHMDKALAIASLPGEQLQQERQKVAEALSDSYYRQSLTLYNQDLDAAIIALRTAIDFNPSNIAAVEKLDQALTLKRNLQRIQEG